MIEFVKDVFEHAKEKEQCIAWYYLDLSELFQDREFSVEYLLQ